MAQNKGVSKDERQLIRLWLAKPEVFFKDVLGWQPWDKQIEILHSIRDNKETFVQSCNAAGKSYLAAGIVLWWIVTRNGKVITTAPTWRQVKDVLWAKIGAMANRSPALGIKPLQAEINIDKDWFAKGLSTRQPEKFAGYHGNVLLVVDEASGVNDPGLWEAMDGNLTDFKHDRMLAIGNPTDPTGEFARRCKFPMSGGVRKVIKISAFDVPNVIHKDVVIPNLITWEFVKQKAEEWGENSPMYAVRILGEFPRTGGDSMFPLAWLDRAFGYDTSNIIDIEAGTTFTQQPDISEGPTVIGFDTALGGTDNNALAYRTGNKVQRVYGWQEIDTSDLVDRLYEWVDLYSPEIVQIDALGGGQPIYAYARKHKKSDPRYNLLRIRPFKASASPIRKDEFANLKAEAYWNFRKLLETNNVDMSMLTGDVRDVVEKQANAIRWKVNAQGKIQVEDKRTMKSREGFSPDELEAIIMSFSGSQNTKPSKYDYRRPAYYDKAPEDDYVPNVAAFEYDFGQYSRS